MQSTVWREMSHYGLKLTIQALPFPKNLIGLDVGKRSTGIAISSYDLQYAHVFIVQFSTSRPSGRTSAQLPSNKK